MILVIALLYYWFMTRLTTERVNRRNLKSKYCLTVVSNYFPNHFDGGFSHEDKKKKDIPGNFQKRVLYL